MVSFLTASFITYQPRSEYEAKPLMADNDFVENLRKYWPKQANLLIFSSNPHDYAMTDHVRVELKDAFSLSGFALDSIETFDDRNIAAYAKAHHISLEEAAPLALSQALASCQILFLAGGHAPTENAFMKNCHFKELLEDSSVFDGLLLALSAGSMNAALDVYLIPELPGEAKDTSFIRHTHGLGLTSLHIVPHSQYMETVSLDGFSVMQDIIYPESFHRDFYLLADGSYFLLHNGMTELFGDCTLLRGGQTWKLPQGLINADCVALRKVGSGSSTALHILDSIMENHCDFVLDIDTESKAITFFHISQGFLDLGIIPVHMSNFEDLCQSFANKLIIPEEVEPFLEQMNLPYILSEIEAKDCFVRTVHIQNAKDTPAEDIRIERMVGESSHLLCYLVNVSAILDHDWMTDEYSRTGFLMRAKKVMEVLTPISSYSVVYSNIKGLKAINDLFGTHGGDMTIFQERDVLVSALKPLIVSRFDADHFALLVDNQYLYEENLNQICHQVYTQEDKQLPFTIRLGIYPLKDNQEPLWHVIDGAKLAEKQISDQLVLPYARYQDEIYTRYMAERKLISELDEAIEKGYIKAFYQPVLDIHTERIVSVEALVRWIHPVEGIISPGLFVPALEKNGLISKIDQCMIDHVLTFHRKRMERNQATVPCAVNLSRVDFYDTKLLGTIRTRVSQSDNIGSLIKFEVTESAYAVLENTAMNFLEEMRAHNISLLLDDFGSGMSSLSTLESFAFDIIKLDMGFVRKIGQNPKTEAIIRSVIDLAHLTGSKVVAEGVETKDQLEFLRAAGCDMIQGYYFYKPMSEEDFAQVLDEKN